MRRGTTLVTAALVVLGSARPASAAETIKVLVPDRGNLQYTSFWVAEAAGFFGEEGIAIELVVPPGPQQTETFFEEAKAEVAVLPPPVYANLIAHHQPVVLIANLLANDPINLIVRKSVMDERHLSASMPLKARLEGLRGLKLGIAPHPPTRLRVLYASVGLDADKDITQVIIHGKEQNEAFENGEIDVLYAHTPFLERALVHDDAEILVNQSAGEVAGLANRQIHTLCVRRSFLELHQPLARGLYRAIAKAEQLARTQPAESAKLLAKQFPNRDRDELERIARLYAPGIPATPAVHAELIPNAVELFPADKTRPDLANVRLADHVSRIDDAVEPVRAPLKERLWFQVGLAMAFAVVFVFSMRRLNARARARMLRDDRAPERKP